ncbi:MAG TPA: conjugal transfer protein TrbF [Candidatus Dormibacteraeota bacterium]|nr:conjugal transfer protein TrbF [Candidatus Dormibacteraeota bacterium]
MKTSEHAADAAALETPYLSARREWNERYGDYIARARSWRWAAFGALALSLVLAVGVVWQGAQSKVVPYVVEVDKLGDAVAVARADHAVPADVHVIKAQLAAWIVDVRSVSSDPLAQKAALSRSYAMTVATATLFLNDYYRQHSPFSQNRTVAVSVDAVLPISKQTYQIQWSEDGRDLQGRNLATTHWLASVTVAFDPPTDERGVLSNPLGLYVTGISWTQHL